MAVTPDPGSAPPAKAAGGSPGPYARILPMLGVGSCFCLIVSFVMVLVMGRVFVWAVGVPFGGSVLLLAAAIGLDWDQFRATLASRRMLVAFMVLVNGVLGVSLVALAGYFLGARHYIHWDWSASREFTLCEETRRVLTRLKDVPAVEAVLVEGSEPVNPERRASWREHLNRVTGLLEQYEETARDLAPGQFSFRVLNLLREPIAGKKLIEDVNCSEFPQEVYNGIVVCSGEKRRLVRAASLYAAGAFSQEGQAQRKVFRGEDAVSSALMALVRGEKHIAYNVVGHGERTPEMGDAGNAHLGSMLAEKGFALRHLPLAQASEVPKETDLLIVQGPKAAWTPEEVGRFEAYLDGGGAALVMFDPIGPGEAEAPSGLEPLLQSYGVKVRQDLHTIRYRKTMTQVPMVSLRLFALPPHRDPPAITESLAKHKAACDMEGACALDMEEKPSKTGYEVNRLLFSTPFEFTEFLTWAEARLGDPKSLDPEKAAIKGPVLLAAEVVKGPFGEPEPKKGEKEKKGAHIVVVADADWACDRLLKPSRANQEFLISAVQALCGEEEVLGIQGRPVGSHDARVQREDLRPLMVLLAIGLPVSVLMFGATIWYLRRR